MSIAIRRSSTKLGSSANPVPVDLDSDSDLTEDDGDGEWVDEHPIKEDNSHGKSHRRHPYRQPACKIMTRDEIRRHPVWIESCKHLRSAMQGKFGPLRAIIETKLDRLMREDAVWAIVEELPHNHTGDPLHGPCVCCTTSSSVCIVEVEFDQGSQRLLVIRKCIKCLAHVHDCSITLPRPGRLPSSPDKRPVKPNSQPLRSTSIRSATARSVIIPTVKAMLATPPHASAAKVRKASDQPGPNKVKRPRRIESPKADVKETDDPKEIIEAVQDIQGFTLKMRAVVSRGGALEWAEKTMFEAVDKQVAFLLELNAPSTLTCSKGFNIKLLAAVNEVGKFVRRLLAMYPIDEDTASYMRQTMFEKVESRIAFLQEIGGKSR